jgi:hypothetical protein
MYRPDLIRSLSISLFLLLLVSAGSAQIQPASLSDDVFDAKLQVILASDRAVKTSPIPSSLSPITDALTRDFALANFQIIDTQIGRLADRGMLETKGAVDLDDPTANSTAPAYTEWNITDSRSGGAPEGSTVTIGSFRYIIRISNRKAVADTEPGKPGTVVAYESYGQTLRRLSVPDSVPTVVGSISLPKGAGTLFLVLTVSKSAK